MRWRTPWSLMSLLNSGKGSRCAFIDPVKGVEHLQRLLRKHRFCLTVPLLWKSCMTKHAIIYINWILVIRQHQPISHSLFVFIYIGFVAAFVNCFLRMVDDETRPELKAQDTQLKAQDTPSVW